MEIQWLALIAATGAGTIGGALNAWLTHNRHMWPTLVRPDASSRIVVPGWLANVCTGASASVTCVVGLGAMPPIAPAFLWRWLIGGAVLFIVGFTAARWLSNEADIRLLRAACCKASAAPAAHPEQVRALALAPPVELYEMAVELMPRPVAKRPK